MSVETARYCGYAFVVGELSASHTHLTDAEAKAKARAMAQAVIGYLVVHFGTEEAEDAIRELTDCVGFLATKPGAS